ncbi:unnamed protein product [Mytilus edulis]|uniref:CCHC-type domain-containing protein n=1 Tax=Mytilus edulis TaxID=6550 RepID=A0A8S3SG81_MYTED|nr:unnamed protein product [Mytilus edulis]
MDLTCLSGYIFRRRKGEELLVSNGLELRCRSVLIYSKEIKKNDFDRYDNRITDCQTGDRIVIVQGPLEEPIPKNIPIGKYRGTVLYRGQNDSIAKCSKCMELGHRASQCQNDWKCRNCGESGHKQIDCTKIDSAEGESIPHNNAEYNEDDTSYYPSHQSNSESDNNDDMNDDETQHPLGDVQPDDLFNCTIDQSQSILTTTTADKTKAASQKLIHQQLDLKFFLHVNQAQQTNTLILIMSNKAEYRSITNDTIYASHKSGIRSTKKNENKQVNTPGKSTSGRGIEKSPVTPTEQLHDGTRNNANKDQKTAPRRHAN